MNFWDVNVILVALSEEEGIGSIIAESVNTFSGVW